MNVVVLLSGDSRRFQEEGYTYPKSLIELAGKPVVEHVMQAYAGLSRLGARFICVIRQDEASTYYLKSVLKILVPEAVIVEAAGPTAGGACTTLLAAEEIDNDGPLIVCNGDQVIDADLRSIVGGFQQVGLDGGIIVFRAVHPRWSFVKCDGSGLVVETSEKRPISDLATAGFYHFRRGRDFVAAAKSMIVKDAHVNGAFYVCPAYNEMILDGARIGVHHMAATDYHSLATPASLRDYEDLLRLRRLG